EHLDEPTHVERVLERLSARLARDREVGVGAHELGEIGGAEPCQPEWGASARSSPGEDERALRRVAKQTGLERRGLDLVGEAVGRLGRGDPARQAEEALGHLAAGGAKEDAVVRSDVWYLDLETATRLRSEKNGPSGVDTPAERRQHRHAGVAEL